MGSRDSPGVWQKEYQGGFLFFSLGFIGVRRVWGSGWGVTKKYIFRKLKI
jgi:hypothetical protein